MLLLSSKWAFHRSGSHSGKFPLGSILHLVLACPAFLGEGGLDSVLLAERSVIVSGVALVATYLLHRHSGQFLWQRYAMLQSGTFIESIEWQLFNEGDTVNQYIVALRSKLYSLGLLTSDYRSDVRLADAYYSVRDTLARVTALEVVLLLTIYPCDSLKHIQLLVIQ